MEVWVCQRFWDQFLKARLPSCILRRSKLYRFDIYHLSGKVHGSKFLFVNIPVYTTIRNAPCLVTRQIRFPHVSISGFETSQMEGSYLVPGAVAPGILNSAGFGGWKSQVGIIGIWWLEVAMEKNPMWSTHSPEIERIDTKNDHILKGVHPFPNHHFGCPC